MKKKEPVVPKKSRLPSIVVVIAILFVIAGLKPPRQESAFNVNQFSELPVLNGGRLKPMDTMARTSLLMMSGKQVVRHEKKKLSAIEWLMEMQFRPAKADLIPVFLIDDPDVLGLMKIEQGKKRRFTFEELRPHMTLVDEQAQHANEVKAEQRSRFQTAVVHLQSRLILYQKLQNTLEISGRENLLHHIQHLQRHVPPLMAKHLEPQKKKGKQDELDVLGEFMNQYNFIARAAEFFPIPAKDKESLKLDWVSTGQAMVSGVLSGHLHPGVLAYATFGDSFRAGDAMLFNQALTDYRLWLAYNVPQQQAKSKHEVLFNVSAPFYRSLTLYVIAFILVFLSWLYLPDTLNRSAFGVLLVAFVVHTVGLVVRIYLQGRPPVTNLYSSAIFVGWASVLFGIVLERIFRKGIGTAVASAIGFITLIVAHHLSTQGDTLEMMRAVLDSNFWLATHVVCITIGYSSTFLSGFLGILYIIRSRFDAVWVAESGPTQEKMVYGVVCFSLFFSFLGTILGGIWADQSWGRFWGWDPKENGALMIVLWNAFILHARWGGIARGRALMAMAVFGNIITGLSWFGVNMLGIGLHSYGFMDKAFWWLLTFVITQLVIIGLAYLPAKSKSTV